MVDWRDYLPEFDALGRQACGCYNSPHKGEDSWCDVHRPGAEAYDRLIAAAPEMAELIEHAPPFLGVWNISGRRSIQSEHLSEFVEEYNAWAELARAILRRVKGDPIVPAPASPS